jgi:hypothetical protein
MKNDSLIAVLEFLLQACREDRIVRFDINQNVLSEKTRRIAISAEFSNETEFSGLSSLVKAACAIENKNVTR